MSNTTEIDAVSIKQCGWCARFGHTTDECTDTEAQARERARSRLAQCIHESGCDERSHDIRCNEVYYARGGTS